MIDQTYSRPFDTVSNHIENSELWTLRSSREEETYLSFQETLHLSATAHFSGETVEQTPPITASLNNRSVENGLIMRSEAAMPFEAVGVFGFSGSNVSPAIVDQDNAGSESVSVQQKNRHPYMKGDDYFAAGLDSCGVDARERDNLTAKRSGIEAHFNPSWFAKVGDVARMQNATPTVLNQPNANAQLASGAALIKPQSQLDEQSADTAKAYEQSSSLTDFLDFEAGSSAVQVALKELENGLKVLVRLPSMDAEHERKLRKAISEIASNHSLSADEIEFEVSDLNYGQRGSENG